VTGGQALPPRAEVVVIGGGVVGTSVAYHLAAAGVRDVLLLEARTLAAGSSGKPLGGVRAQFSDELNIRLGAYSLDAFRRFPEEIGFDIGWQQVGYLFLLRDPAVVAGFERSIALQHDLGVDNRLLDPAEARERNPYLNTDGLLAAAYSPGDGYARPGDVVRGYAAAARRRGARVTTGCEVVGIETSEREITAVHTSVGTVRAGAVVCAAGAWSTGLGAMVGVDLPVRPLRRQIAMTPPLSPPPARIPFTIDFDSTLYFHNCGDGLLVGRSDPDQEYGFDTTYTDDWLPTFRAEAARIAPGLADLPLPGGWAGLYEMTPDCNALIGEAPGVRRFLYATGFSGHGFLQAPAAGALIRDLYLGREPFCDVFGFDAARFGAARFEDTARRTELTII
jgi:sarcosine oxidase subunit beta